MKFEVPGGIRKEPSTTCVWFAAVASAQLAFDYAQKQFHAGTINILTLLNTQNALSTAEDLLVQVKYARLQALTGLYVAAQTGSGDESGVLQFDGQGNVTATYTMTSSGRWLPGSSASTFVDSTLRI